MPLRWGNPLRAGQAPPLRSSAVPRFSHIQAGAAGALQRKPPPPENHRQNSPGEVPRRGNRNSPFLAVSRGGLLRRGKSGPQRLCREEGTITGARRRQDKKTDTKRVPMEGAPAWHKAGRCGQKVNCPRGAREAAWGRRPLPGGGGTQRPGWAVKRRSRPLPRDESACFRGATHVQSGIPLPLSFCCGKGTTPVSGRW